MVKQESDEDYWLGESFSPVFRAGLETLMPTPKFDRLLYGPHVEDSVQELGNPSLPHGGQKSTRARRHTSTTLSERGARRTSKYSTL